MPGRIPADEEVWLDHKLKTQVDMDYFSLLARDFAPGPVEVEVDTYAA